MKKIWLIIMILLSSLVAQASDPDSINRKWELGVFYLPSRIFTAFTAGDINNYPIGLAILINKNTSKNFSFETGINYKYQWLNKSMYLESASFEDIEEIIKHNTNIFEIPVKVKYYPFNKSKLLFYFTGGITNSFFFRESSYQVEENINRYNQKYYFFVVNLGIGFQYKVIKRVGVIFETYCGYGVSVTKPTESGYLDFKTGVAYHF
ncbi:MAG: outer membrane beta-barrel protein [Bacteroidales bacterium]|nr:outer membrane beta-barrel protein [Bacteroidales bacterium]